VVLGAMGRVFREDLTQRREEHGEEERDFNYERHELYVMEIFL